MRAILFLALIACGGSDEPTCGESVCVADCANEPTSMLCAPECTGPEGLTGDGDGSRCMARLDNDSMLICSDIVVDGVRGCCHAFQVGDDTSNEFRLGWFACIE